MKVQNALCSNKTGLEIQAVLFQSRCIKTDLKWPRESRSPHKSISASSTQNKKYQEYLISQHHCECQEGLRKESCFEQLSLVLFSKWLNCAEQNFQTCCSWLTLPWQQASKCSNSTLSKLLPLLLPAFFPLLFLKVPRRLTVNKIKIMLCKLLSTKTHEKLFSKVRTSHKLRKLLHHSMHVNLLTYLNSFIGFWPRRLIL